jgi:alpha-mannosidase
MLKLSFPVDVLEPKAIYEIPYGTIERSTQGQEEPGQRWLDLLGKDGEGKEKGLLLANDSKYGFSVDGSEMRVSIVRSPIFAFHRPRKPEPGKTYVYTDQGKHSIGLLLYPHFGAASEEKFQLAERLNNPPIVAFSNSHTGSLPSASSLVSCEPCNVLVGALKVAEEHDDIILRLFESAGRQTRCDVAFPLLGIEFTTDISPWEIKTLAISRDGMARETDLLE